MKPIIDSQLTIIENELICNQEATLGQWEITEVINIFDYNFDGILVTYKATIDE